MALLTEGLAAQDRHSWGVVAHDHRVTSVANNLLGESGCIELVEHDWLSILALILVGTIILAECKAEVLALSRGEVWHETLGTVGLADSLVHLLLQHNWIALAETVNALVWLIVYTCFV